ncbi:MAG: flagellar motor switch protein FliN [Solirubrobacteraceae bacterium]|nr:flagellar motor switch protein FliN [Solirubrobacteraceae bacterium]
MSEITALEPAHVTAPPLDSGDGLRRLAQVRVELSVEIGRTRMSLGEALALGPGSVIALDRMADQPVDLLVNGKLVARGEVVVIDAEYGLRVTEVVGAEPQPVTVENAGGIAPAPGAEFEAGAPEAPPAIDPVAEAIAAAPAAEAGGIDQAAIDAAIAAAQAEAAGNADAA